MKDILFDHTRENDVHWVWFKFVRYFAKPYKGYRLLLKNGKWIRSRKKDKNYYDLRDGRGTFKWTGYDLILKVEQWAKKYPKDIFISVCDDCLYMGSRLCYIVHRSKKDYHGVTVIYIPQSGEDPSIHFLYPNHMEHVYEVFGKILKLHGNKKSNGIEKFKKEINVEKICRDLQKV
jgi:hypothetical protein